MFKVGQKVTVHHPGESYDGEEATVIMVCPSAEPFMYKVEMTSENDEGETQFWMGADDLKAVEPESEPEPVLGIGGIGIFEENEMPIIPSEAALARLERMEKTDIVCKRCGASKNFDGAMFTTLPGESICDDCL